MMTDTISTHKPQTPLLKVSGPISGEQLFHMPIAGQVELVKGEIITKMPTGYKHGYIEALIAALLFNFVRTKRLGRVLGGEIGIYTSRDPDSVRAADAAFISNERYEQVKSSSYLDICPELIIEILSPDDSWTDMYEKLAEYFSIDAQIVWVIDPRLEQIHVFHSLDDVFRLTLDDQLSGEGILPGFEVPVREIFAEEN